MDLFRFSLKLTKYVSIEILVRSFSFSFALVYDCPDDADLDYKMIVFFTTDSIHFNKENSKFNRKKIKLQI
jgi:hypothetical protein